MLQSRSMEIGGEMTTIELKQAEWDVRVNIDPHVSVKGTIEAGWDGEFGLMWETLYVYDVEARQFRGNWMPLPGVDAEKICVYSALIDELRPDNVKARIVEIMAAQNETGVAWHEIAETPLEGWDEV